MWHWLLHLSLGLISLAAAAQLPFTLPPPTKNVLLTPSLDTFISSQLTFWNSSGLSVAVVQKNKNSALGSGWTIEFGSYGQARSDGSPVTPDTLFAIASDSKLFLAMGVGLLISNDSLAAQRGRALRWDTRIGSVLPEWELMDEEMERGVTIQDMLSHRTGIPGHLYAYPTEGQVAEMISKFRYFRPSAALREQYQYSNWMYTALSHLQPTLLNQSFESYIAQHIFMPLGMNASTYSVAEVEARGTLAHGHHWSMKDLQVGRNGTRTATVPYFQRPGEERFWAGAAGILSSARDLSRWLAMLLNNGRHPETNETIIPESVVEHTTLGSVVLLPKAEFPETSPKVYGCGQSRFSYRGHEILEHGGSNPGFKTIVSRLPEDDFGVIVLSNDDTGVRVMEPVKFAIIDKMLGLEPIDWRARYIEADVKARREAVKPPRPRPVAPTQFEAMEGVFENGAYGILAPCFVSTSSSQRCISVLADPVVRRIVDPNIPTFIAPFKRTFATHVRLEHWQGNVFNASVVWSNGDVRRKEGYATGMDTGMGSTGLEDTGDVVVGLDNHFEAEWVPSSADRVGGWAFRGDFWGKFGEVRELEGSVEEKAEVWFARVEA
ncbi:beta-lactamase/transpeptidase-like protein [Roridomyces roridus]|uniref:Beta-lactamase/transpeptidase-like protein n=1 Tax=Roridomyces roridus TaxID=1738132 RepID=A0AAD7FHP6_9AGAR|nr:beta-lactamase/transpeptidase-like protein [Roridomyces roridus]